MSEVERESRRARLEALRQQGVDPYPARTGPRQQIAQLRQLPVETVARATSDNFEALFSGVKS